MKNDTPRASAERHDPIQRSHQGDTLGQMEKHEEGDWIPFITGQNLERDLHAEREETARLRQALDRIARPIWWMQVDAKAEGCTINAMMAAQLAESGSYLRGIAEKALSSENAEVSHGDRKCRPDTHSTHKQT